MIAVVSVRLDGSRAVNNRTTVPDGVLDDAPMTLELGSAQSLVVDATGNVSLNAADDDYLLFSFWERPVGHRLTYGGLQGSDTDSKSIGSRLS